MLCKNPNCKTTIKQNAQNPTRRWCSQECCNLYRRERRARLKKLKAKYKKIGDRERRALKHIFIMGLENPTDTQIKDVCGSFVANWFIVKENLELRELANNSNYFNYGSGQV